MITKEFIAMCDCKEVWNCSNKNAGDLYYNKEREKVEVLINFNISEFRFVELSFNRGLYNYPTLRDHIHLINIEDLIEKCEKFRYNIDAGTLYSKRGIYKYQISIYKTELHANVFKEKSVNEAMLCGYMWAEHNKLWNLETKQWENE